jgi:PPM family protein phosphatase
MTVCPQCTAEVGGGDRFCEACGFDLVEHTMPALVVVPAAARVSVAGEGVEVAGGGHWVSSARPVTACSGCGGTSFGAEGYCEDCGQRRASTQDHTELDLGAIAAVTDRGKRHRRNEDAVALAAIADVVIAIVCDGVSSSTRPDAASTGAVNAAAPAVVDALTQRASAADAISAAARAAQAAATLAAGPDPGSNPPASTFVCAVVASDAVTVGWVGDSRAYWLPDAKSTEDGSGRDQPICLTVDDSVAGQAAAAGLAVPNGLPAGALVRWLGADATDTAPHVRTFTPPGPGRVLVCSDGLFKYRPDPTALAATTPALRPLPTAQALIAFALEAGGADNISAAVLPYPPPSSKEST